MQPTSLKLSPELKKRIAALAKHDGKSVHAYLIEAIEQHAGYSERRREFIEQALAADAEMERTGMGYPLEEVHAYFRARAAGKKARRPRLRSWRK
jgi:predicted DNA-binding protein